MKKSDLIRTIQMRFNRMNKSDAERVISTFFDVLGQQAAAGHRIEIRRFGTFENRVRAAKIGFNPYSKEMIAVPASQRLHFKVSAELSKSMNGDAGFKEQ